MASFSYVEKDFGLKGLKQALKKLAAAKPYVKVGVLGDGAKNRRPGEAIDNVTLALVQEFGSPANNIPARSFIRAPFMRKRDEYLAMLKKLAKGTLSRKPIDVLAALGIVGEKIAADFKASMPGTPPPNSPEVYARKLAKGSSGGEPKTLVDSGRLLNSITYAVVKGEK